MKYILLLVLLSISCGATSQAALIHAPVSASMTAVRAAVSAEPTEQGTRTGIVCADRLNLRMEPGQWNDVMLADGLQRGQIVTLTGAKLTPLDAVYEWYEVRVTVDGVEYRGWVNGVYICLK